MIHSKFERTRRANSFIIRHPQFNDIVDAINECIEDTEIFPEPECITIDGESGVGKSTIAAYLLRAMPRFKEGRYQRMPAICLPVPVAVTHSKFASAFLDVLGDPSSSSGTQSTKTKRIIHYLRNVTQTKVVFFDEFHHLYDSETKKVLNRSSEWMKLLIRESGCTFVTIGIKDRVNAIFNSNEQLRRHFSSYTLDPFEFDLNKPATVDRFKKVIVGIENEVGIKIAPTIKDDERAFRIHRATNGKIGYIMALVRKSVLMADKQNLPNIPLSLLETVFDKRISNKVNLVANPFRPDARERGK